MAELRSQDNGNLSQRLRRDPLPHLRALEAACHEIATETRPGYDKNGMYFVVVDCFGVAANIAVVVLPMLLQIISR